MEEGEWECGKEVAMRLERTNGASAGQTEGIAWSGIRRLLDQSCVSISMAYRRTIGDPMGGSCEQPGEEG